MTDKIITLDELRLRLKNDIVSQIGQSDICPRCLQSSLWPPKYSEFNTVSSKTGDVICVACGIAERFGLEDTGIRISSGPVSARSAADRAADLERSTLNPENS